MKKETLSKNQTFSAIHKTAMDLHAHQLIDKKKMQEYDFLCLKPVPKYTMREIKEIRKKLKLSQAVLAAILNTSLSTVQKWEVGEKQPSGPSLKLLHILKKKGIEALI